MSQGKQAASRSRKSQENVFFLEPSERNRPCQNLDFSPVKLTLDSGHWNCRKIHLRLVKPVVYGNLSQQQWRVHTERN